MILSLSFYLSQQNFLVASAALPAVNLMETLVVEIFPAHLDARALRDGRRAHIAVPIPLHRDQIGPTVHGVAEPALAVAIDVLLAMAVAGHGQVRLTPGADHGPVAGVVGQLLHPNLLKQRLLLGVGHFLLLVHALVAQRLVVLVNVELRRQVPGAAPAAEAVFVKCLAQRFGDRLRRGGERKQWERKINNKVCVISSPVFKRLEDYILNCIPTGLM